MGRDKAQVTLGGQTLLNWVFGAMSKVVSEVVVVGGERAEGIRPPADAPAGIRGPAAGIATALREGGGRPVVVVGVDQPWVQPSTLAALLEVRPSPAAPLDRRLQVTCATYPPRSLPQLEEAARKERSLQPVIPRLGGTAVAPEQWRSWGEDGRSWHSVDTPEDLQEGLRRYGVPRTPPLHDEGSG